MPECGRSTPEKDMEEKGVVVGKVSTLLGLVPHWAQAPGIHPLLGIQLTQLTALWLAASENVV